MSTLFMFGGIVPISSKAASNQEVYQTENAIYDYRMVSEKSNVKERLDSTLKANPVNSSKVSRFLIPPLVSATATSKSTVKEDYIQAKVRAYNDSGGLWGSATDTNYKSQYAGATYNTKSKWISFAYGNHIYKLAGYKDVYHETYTR